MKFGNLEWHAYTHTKWDSSRYDNAYFGIVGVKKTFRGNKESISLTITKSPKYFRPGEIIENYSKDGKEKLYCCGELIGDAVSYGELEWKVTMPEYPNLWPALWLYGKDSWPPEIDLLEGYTGKNGYVENIFRTTLESNIHIRKNHEEGTHINIGAKGIPTLLYKLLHKKVDTYKVIWTPDYIKFYFNGIRTRIIKDTTILSDFNINPKMYPVMNMMILDGYKHPDDFEPEMIIHDFKYTPYVK